MESNQVTTVEKAVNLYRKHIKDLVSASQDTQEPKEIKNQLQNVHQDQFYVHMMLGNNKLTTKLYNLLGSVRDNVTKDDSNSYQINTDKMNSVLDELSDVLKPNEAKSKK